ncbi:Na+/H+ antiporter NhaA [Alteromonas sp.]|nr:Na+/H+ antiporter NhaA [Alteromonas sp.]
MKVKKLVRSLLADRRGHAEQLPKSPIDWLTHPLARFFKIEALAGLVLLFFTLLALYLANSSWSSQYTALWQVQIGIQFGAFSIEHTLHDWINDGVMSLFFFLIALELKRELVWGELHTPKLAMLAVSAAFGGMVVPACVYLAFQNGESGQHGWGTVMATDTAFVIGCLALLGKRIPRSMRVFMLSLAIVDDIGAILVIAIGYSNGIEPFYVGASLIVVALVKIMSSLGIRSIFLFFVVGVLLWFFIGAAGIHPTVAGIMLGLMTPTTRWVSEARLHDIVHFLLTAPLSDSEADEQAHSQSIKTAELAAREALSPVERLEHMLHPWVGFVVMPLFAFANAGIPLAVDGMLGAITMAVFFGFVVGKPAGVFLFSWAALTQAVFLNLPFRLSTSAFCVRLSG